MYEKGVVSKKTDYPVVSEGGCAGFTCGLRSLEFAGPTSLGADPLPRPVELLRHGDITLAKVTGHESESETPERVN